MAALERGGGWQRLDAIEIDPRAADVCNSRLAIPAPHASVRRANAFDPSTWQQVANERWDLVITNPPYVRYQRGSAGSLGEIAVPSAQQVRLGLLAVLDSYTALPEADRKVWRYVARHYGGLSDLAVPSWILCSAMVAPGGRLAIVAPDTWLSRECASPVLYLLRRYFEIEAVVEDGDASWFPGALVRTTLLVARRVSDRGSGLIEGSATYRHVRLGRDDGYADERGRCVVRRLRRSRGRFHQRTSVRQPASRRKVTPRRTDPASARHAPSLTHHGARSF